MVGAQQELCTRSSFCDLEDFVVLSPLGTPRTPKFVLFKAGRVCFMKKRTHTARTSEISKTREASQKSLRHDTDSQNHQIRCARVVLQNRTTSFLRWFEHKKTTLPRATSSPEYNLVVQG